MEKDVILTTEGYEKLKQQIEDLETTKRREVADRIREAREFGDISENSEYDDAKNEQALLEHRIARLKEQLRSARVIDTKDVGTDVVSVGTQGEGQGRRPRRHRHLRDRRIGRGRPGAQRGSRTSRRSAVPLLGHKKGETVEVAVPAGAIRLKIMDIKAPEP